MEAFVAFKYLHIAAMFFAVALAVSGEVVMRRIATSGDVRAIRTALDRSKPLGNIATGLFLAGAAFGIVAALTGQINLLQPWLIAAYVTFVAAMAIGITITDPWLSRLGAAAYASPEGAASPELLVVINDERARMATWALMFIVAFFVFLMVVQPGG